MSKTAFLFPGQGSQSVGMGRDLASSFPIARRTFEEANDALGFDLADLCFQGPEEQLRLTEFTQPAIFTVSVAALRVLAEAGVWANTPPMLLPARLNLRSPRARFAAAGS
jgi:[acyl-carrier-protein] S-malonyltransferase